MLDADLRLTLTDQLDVLYSSDRVERLLGYRREDLASSASLQPLLHPEDFVALRALFEPGEAAHTGATLLRIRGADGRIRCISFRYLREKTSRGAVELTLHIADSGLKARPPELHASTADMLALLDNLDQCACLKGRDHVIRQVNRSFQKLFHEQDREIIGLTDYDLFPEDYADKAYEAEQQVFAGSAVARFALEASDRSGIKRSFENRSLPVHDDRGQVESVCSVVVDTTALFHAERALRISEDAVKEAHTVWGLGSFTVNLRTRTWTASDTLHEILGLTRQSPHTIDIWSQLVYPEDLARIGNLYGELVMSRQLAFDWETRFIRSNDQATRWARLQGKIERDAQGRPHLLRGTIADTTERKAADAKVSQSASLLQLCIQNAPTGLAMFDREMRYMAASRRWIEDRGLNAWEIIGRHGDDVHPHSSPRWLEDHRRALAGESGAFREDSYVDESGVERWVHRMVVPWWDEGAVAGVVIFSEDTTARKQAYLDLRKSEESLREAQVIAGVGSYVFDMAHDSWTSSQVLDEIFGIDQSHDRSREGWQALVHPDDREMMASYVVNEVIGRGVPFNKEYRIVRASDQAMLWVHGRGKVERDVNGNPTNLHGTIQDITERKNAEALLRESRHVLQLFIEHAPVAIAMFDRDMRYLAASRRWVETFNLIDREILGRSLYEVFPDLPSRWREAHRRGLAGEGLRLEEDLFGLPDGTKRWTRRELLPWYKDDGAVGGIVLFIEDITTLKESADRLQLAASVFTHTSESIVITDAEGAILDVNDAFTRITGYSREDVLGQNPRILNSGRQPPEFYADLWAQLKEKGQWSGEIWNRGKSGQILPGMLTISSVPDEKGKPKEYVGHFSDLSPVKERDLQLKQIAHFDALTGLPNRSLLADRLGRAMAQARRKGQMLAVAYLDFDNFSAINERHGHIIGDELINVIIQRMTSILHEADTLARMGGDEFVAVLLDLSNIEEGLALAGQIQNAVAESVQLGDLKLQVSASIGFSFYPQGDEVEPDQLVRQADQAMYFAKLAGKARLHVFDPMLDRSMRGRHEDLQRMRQAMKAEEFELFFQPKVNMRTGAVLGAEALIRWRHPELGLLLPQHFLPVMAGNLLIVELGEWVISTALAQMESWRALGLDIPVSVNVDAMQLQEPHFVERLTALLAMHPQIHPTKLELEVLESSAFEDVSQVSEVIRACSRLGVTFALDDFGTGYSSLSYLRRLPVDVLKIDRSFVHDMLDDPEDLTILEGVLVLANAFRRLAIAEGVETVDHGLMLLRLGCQIGQGFQIARPMPGSDLPGWAARWRPDPRWVDVTAIDRVNWPILHAGVEHRAWTTEVEEFLQGSRTTPPAMDSHLCRLGSWLDAEKLSGHGAQAGVRAIDELHHQLHAQANEMLRTRPLDRGSAPIDGLQQLHALKDNLLESLQQHLQGL
ncbi:MAG TPA: EAL domain-containing protein [Terracidiphilus sp.]|nr:EAL domain-containing protein [Terracidiphilus sp.]